MAIIDHKSIIKREVQAHDSLISSVEQLLKDTISQETLTSIITQQFFTPKQDEEIAYWFAKFITVRENLWEVVDTALNNTGGIRKLASQIDWQYFVLGYSSVCSLIRLDRFLLNNIAYDTIIQRKLNESFPLYRIQRKQYSHIFSQLVLPSNAIRIHEAHRLLVKNHSVISTSVKGSSVEHIFLSLRKQESHINLSKKQYFIAWLANRRHALRRRGASAKQKTMFAVLEYGGKAVSEISLPKTKRVTQAIISEIENFLQPGDIFVTRHNGALTNLFLPGFWPHAALYIGSQNQQTLPVNSDSQYLKYWTGTNRTLEALKDGVHFRRLEDTLNVDAFVVIRPNFQNGQISQAISRAISHAGKGYNFDFDFFRSDQLVCTEVIYRAYDGIDNVNIPLQERMGRKTFSAEDLLDLSINTNWGEPIAIFGIGKHSKKLITGEQVLPLLINSYKESAQQ